MVEIGKAVGTAVEGGLYSKAGDGAASSNGVELKNGYFAEGPCRNCGTDLIGNHCHNCGQKAHLHRTIGAFMHDLLHGALHFEGRTWKTLPKLVFKPGELTRRYIDGERVRFVSPMALFLFSIFLMFAVFQFAGISAPSDLRGGAQEELTELAALQYERIENRLVSAEELLEDQTIPAAERERLETERDSLREQIEALRQAGESVPFLEAVAKDRTEGSISASNLEDASVIPLAGSDGATMTMQTSGVDWIDGGLEKWRRDPGLMLYKLQTNFYKFSWLLIPLSIPFVWLLFAWKRRFTAYDHAIFITYSLSFMTLLILVVTMLGIAGLHAAFLTLTLTLVPPVHMYKQLRGTYGLSRFSALWRLGMLTIFILVVLTLFLQLLLLIGIF